MKIYRSDQCLCRDSLWKMMTKLRCGYKLSTWSDIDAFRRGDDGVYNWRIGGGGTFNLRRLQVNCSVVTGFLVSMFSL